MAAAKRPNEALRLLLAEAEWTGQSMADAVNSVGAESGLELQYRRASVTHWLSGMQPKLAVMHVIAEAFSRRLKRRIEIQDLGFLTHIDSTDAGIDASEWRVDTVARLIELHTGRRKLLNCTYAMALTVPSWMEAKHILARPANTPAPAPAVEAHIEVAESMAEIFSSADITFGGGQARNALSGYLATGIAPILSERMPPATRRKLFSVATRLAYLQAFMCFDEELHGAAQRHYQIASNLAADNGDPVAYAVTLRAMSVQAHTLGHHQHAVTLAEAALRDARGAAAPRVRAFLYGQAAVAAAGSGDRHAALTHLAAAERLIEQASNGPAPVVGAYHESSLAHQQATVLSALGDTSGACTALARSLRQRPVAERRARAITLSRLAELQLGQGHLELAAATWHSFLDDYAQLSSGRVRTAFKTMRARLRPYQKNHAANAVLRRANGIAAP